MIDPDQRALLDQLYDAYVDPLLAPRLDLALAASLDLDADGLRRWIRDSHAGEGPGARLAGLSRQTRQFSIRAAWERLATREVIPLSWLSAEAIHLAMCAPLR